MSASPLPWVYLKKSRPAQKHPLAPNRILEISLKSHSRCNMKLEKRSTNMVASDHFFAIATPISSPMPIHCLTVTSKLFTHVWHIINSLQQSDNMMYHLFCWILKLFKDMVWWFNTSNNNLWCPFKSVIQKVGSTISKTAFPRAAANLEKCWEEPWCSTHNDSPENDCCHVRLKRQIHRCHMVTRKRITAKQRMRMTIWYHVATPAI